MFCRVLYRSTGVCRRSRTERGKSGSRQMQNAGEKTHCTPIQVPFNQTSCAGISWGPPLPPPLRLLLFPANPSSSYNPFAFESKRTWGMRKKKTFSPIFSFRFWQRNKDLNSFLMTNSISVSFCIGCSDNPLRVFLLHASVILRFVLFLFVCNQGCGEILIFLFQVRVVSVRIQVIIIDMETNVWKVY